MTRAEHLRWCKDRALECAAINDAGATMSSLMQDLAGHAETAASAQIVSDLMFPLVLSGSLNSVEKLTEFVEGFN